MNDFEQQGTTAFANGDPRIVPRNILCDGDPNRAVGEGDGIANVTAWYRGWDRANLAAPVEDD